METTTIQVTKDQRQRLEQLKDQGGYSSLKSVIAELLETGEITVAGIDEAEAREIAQETVTDMVTYKALEQ
jgi:predicted CopG family antitoxin